MYVIILYMLYVYNCVKLQSPGIRKHFLHVKVLSLSILFVIFSLLPDL